MHELIKVENTSAKNQQVKDLLLKRWRDYVHAHTIAPAKMPTTI